MEWFRTTCTILSFLALFAGCKPDPSLQDLYHPPESTGDGLATGTLAEAVVDSGLIKKAVRSINQGIFKDIHSMLIYTDGKLVFEEYFSGHMFRFDSANHQGEILKWERDSLHRIMSVTKSITSICVGIAVDKGFIKSVHQSIFDYLPEYQHLKIDGKSDITIEHMLTMTSGLRGNEWLVPYSNAKNDIITTYWADDPIEFVLNKPLAYKPGDYFQYYGGSNFVLAEIIKNATKMNLDAFSGRYLFEPLDISEYYWIQLNKGVVDGAGGLNITPRAMTKIGVLFLNDGMWHGKRIISKYWIEHCSTPYPGNYWLNNWDDHWGLRGYSYAWWTHHFVRSGKRMNMYYAAGWGGQYIMIIPELKTVVVFTGGNYASYRPPFEILKKYIIPAFN